MCSSAFELDQCDGVMIDIVAWRWIGGLTWGRKPNT